MSPKPIPVFHTRSKFKNSFIKKISSLKSAIILIFENLSILKMIRRRIRK